MNNELNSMTPSQQEVKENQVDCNHYFKVGQLATESTDSNYSYHKVSYAICRKCGKTIKKDD